ncbi:hypothetical protein CBOM_03574 [Ceraceosorus bombacis]|uniref:Uncharacterized protein n=1 Tax=Ceraceosorus bombacis TaxID=401625 RepID=A0A0P1BHX8_9BASI|nr:hypothetical protein CBOM_03574 [Ceraceosorus bombacis]
MIPLPGPGKRGMDAPPVEASGSGWQDGSSSLALAVEPYDANVAYASKAFAELTMMEQVHARRSLASMGGEPSSSTHAPPPPHLYRRSSSPPAMNTRARTGASSSSSAQQAQWRGDRSPKNQTRVREDPRSRRATSLAPRSSLFTPRPARQPDMQRMTEKQLQEVIDRNESLMGRLEVSKVLSEEDKCRIEEDTQRARELLSFKREASISGEMDSLSLERQGAQSHSEPSTPTLHSPTEDRASAQPAPRYTTRARRFLQKQDREEELVQATTARKSRVQILTSTEAAALEAQAQEALQAIEEERMELATRRVLERLSLAGRGPSLEANAQATRQDEDEDEADEDEDDDDDDDDEEDEEQEMG